MKFLADMGVDIRVVEWLRKQGHDTVHLRDQNLQRLPNGQIFEKAIGEGRVVLTLDLDFGEIVMLSGGRKAGVVLFRLQNTRFARLIERLARVLPTVSEVLASGAVVVVEEARHRIRPLPVGSDAGKS